MQVHVPLYDPSSILQMVVCSAQPKVHKARVLTRAVRSMLTQVSQPEPCLPMHSYARQSGAKYNVAHTLSHLDVTVVLCSLHSASQYSSCQCHYTAVAAFLDEMGFHKSCKCIVHHTKVQKAK